jgi:hypothetical protein
MKSQYGDTPVEAEQLREQIEETRRGMGETIDAIQEKLSFSNISEQVQAQVSSKSAARSKRRKTLFLEKLLMSRMSSAEVQGTLKNGFGRKSSAKSDCFGNHRAGIGALLVGALVGDKQQKE